MRRKFSPQPIERPVAARPLSAALAGSRLPTAAVLAVALASMSMACASRGEDVQADPVAVRAPLVVPSTTAAPTSSSSGPGTNVIDPEPHPLPGEAAIVTPPVPSTVSTVKPKHVPATVPTFKHRTAGVPPRVKPGGPTI